MHSYHFKHYHGECGDGMYDSEILVKKPDDDFLHMVNPGSIHDDMFEIEAGMQFEVTVYTNFKESDKMPRDWSLVAWAEKEPIIITHNDGIKSGSFFNMDLDEEAPIPEEFELEKTFGSLKLANAPIQDISGDSD